MQKNREPIAAGRFYPKDPTVLRDKIKKCFKKENGPGRLPEKKEFTRNIKGAIVPHAGYNYSGPVAAHAYLELAESKTKDTVIVIGPNHTGLGGDVSIQTEGKWEFPIGEMKIDSSLANKIAELDFVNEDSSAFAKEHSIEVQLPFLRYTYGSKVKFVPICMLNQTHEMSKKLGLALAELLKQVDKDVVVLGTSDFTHYMPQKVAEKKDKKFIEPLLVMDDTLFMEKVLSHDSSICGYGVISTTLIVSKNLGSKSGTLLKYATSGDISGRKNNVVGYASIIFE